MPSTDALLAVILLAILINVALASALLFVPRLRAGLGRTKRELATPNTTGLSGASGRSLARAGIGVFGPFGAMSPFNDPETGFDLPATWSRWLDEEDARIRRYRRSATIVFVEIEGLERLIERLGDDTGARLVPPVAISIKRHARETDRFARLGVGRFGVLLAETDQIQAINYVERIRNACDSWLEAGGIASRLTIGWAEANNTHSIEAAVAAAEDRLNADRRGRPPLEEVAEPDDDELEDTRASA